MTDILKRKLTMPTLFLKTLGGLFAGIAGTVFVLIFVFSSLSFGASSGPFVVFGALATALLVSLGTNAIASWTFCVIDKEKYPPIVDTIQKSTAMSIALFVFLLPVYALTAAVSSDIRAIFLVMGVHLVLSCQATAALMELVPAKAQRERLLSVYAITFGMLLSVIINILVYRVVEGFTLRVEGGTDRAIGAGATALLFSALPITWMSFGFMTCLLEMLYRWFVSVWGKDFLREDG